MVSLIYVDTSVVVSAYLSDEPEHEALRHLIWHGDEPVVTSEITRLEVASAIAAAHRANRVATPQEILNRFDIDCYQDRLITLLNLDPQLCLPIAQKLVSQHSLRTLGAIHLATALTEAASLADGGEVVMATRDKRQADAARANGLVVR